VNIQEAGTYNLIIRAAAASTGFTRQMHVELDGVDVTGIIELPVTGGWQNWQDVTVGGVNLTQGSHTITLYMDGRSFNLNYIDFTIDKVILLGDVDGNGEVTIYDAALCVQIALDLKDPTPREATAADYDQSDEVTIYDASLIAQKALGLI